MSAPRILSQPFRPEPLRFVAGAKTARRLVERRRRAARAARWPAALLGTANCALFTRLWLPETRGLPLLEPLLQQLEPLAAWPLLALGRIPDGPPGGAVAGFALLAALTLGTASDRGGFWRHLAPPAAAVLLLACLALLPDALADFPARIGAFFVLLACIGFGGSVLSGRWRAHRAREADPYARPMPNAGAAATSALLVFCLFLLPPIALGRALLAPEVRERSAQLVDSGSSAAPLMLLSPATLLSLLGGVAAALVLWSLTRLLPPHRIRAFAAASTKPPYAWPAEPLRRRLTGPAVTAAVTIVAVVALVAPAADAQGAALVERSRSAAPSGWGCTGWSAESLPGRHLLGADGCRRVDAYLGYERVAVGGEELGQAIGAELTTPEGERIARGPIAAVYDPLLVLVGSTREDGRADAVVGLRFEDASTAWRFSCPGGEPLRTVRLAGSAQEDPWAGRQTLDEEGELVLVGCQDGLHLLDPRSGAEL